MDSMEYEELIKSKDRVIFELEDKLQMASRQYAELVNSEFKIGKVIRRSKGHDELLMVVDVHSEPGGVVVITA
jgi:hypothetical protein